MRNQPRRLLAAAAAATLVSGLALASAPAASAAPVATATPTADPGPHGKASPVQVTVNGFPETVRTGTAVEFTATLRNTADHAVDAETAVSFSGVDGGLQQSQLKLEFQRPGGSSWQDARPTGGQAPGASWELDGTAAPLHLAAGASADYRLRLTLGADAHPGRAAGGLGAKVTDPTLPVDQRTTFANGGTPNFTVVDANPTTRPTPAGLADLAVEGVPATFTAGGPAKPFRLVLANRTGTDLRVLPWIVLQGQNVVRASSVRLEFQTQDGRWLPGTPEEWEIPGTQLAVWLRTGNQDADAVTVPKGETRTVNVRLAFTRDTPAGAESVTVNGGSLPGPGETQNGTTSPRIDFAIEAPAGGTGTPAPATSPAGAAPAPTLPAVPPSVPAAQAAVPVLPVVQATTAVPSPVADDAPRVVAAAPAAPAPIVATDDRLASTGGGPSSAPMAITGATAIVLGLGTLVAHRRKGAHRAGK
ncbi:hypothetical protein ACIRS1_12840 [Kitasatospora sp. NPDC101176]|uniref:hypothetical protein n=1 Tax=Kitasatospora sp. NPDC101176 TaxID=3364099 RepID=UPI0037FCAF9A